jgi:hypothetical protein
VSWLAPELPKGSSSRTGTLLYSAARCEINQHQGQYLDGIACDWPNMLLMACKCRTMAALGVDSVRTE